MASAGLGDEEGAGEVDVEAGLLPESEGLFWGSGIDPGGSSTPKTKSRGSKCNTDQLSNVLKT